MIKSKLSRFSAAEMLKDECFQSKKLWFLPINDADIVMAGGKNFIVYWLYFMINLI